MACVDWRVFFLPQELKDVPQWIVWRNETRNGKQYKVPVNESGPINANDRTYWLDLPAARAMASRIKADGIGLVLTEGCGIAVIDLDGCRQPDGKLAPWARDVLNRITSYTEVSPSGTGLKIFVRAGVSLPNGKGAISTIPDARQFTPSKLPGLEVFTHSRFVTVTGRRLKRSPNTVAWQSDELASLLATWFPVTSVPARVTNSLPTVSEMRDLIDAARLPSKEHDGRAYVYCNDRFPCPKCGSRSWCYVAADGRHLFCSRASEQDGNTTAGGEHVRIRLHDDTGEECESVHSPRGVTKKTVGTDRRDSRQDQHWSSTARVAREALSQEMLNELAARLGVSSRALKKLGVGFATCPEAWTFSELDDSGHIIGINRRFVAAHSELGRQAAIYGSCRGIYYERDWREHDGPLLIPEGASDTAAAIMLGYSAVGRPSASGGGNYIASLLHDFPNDRQIIVLAEHDEKPNGEHPGLTGALRTCRTLATALQRPIPYTFVGDSKDLRAFVNEATGGDLSPEVIARCRQQLDRLLDERLEWVEPQRHYRLPSAPGLVSLGAWRQQQLEARTNSLLEPGVYLDRSGTGTGKSYADNQAIADACRLGTRVALIVPTHTNCAEVAAELRDQCGVEAATFPELSTVTCRKYKLARRCVNEWGLNLYPTLCISCTSRPTCRYRCGVASAHKADVVVATTKRLETDDRLIRGRKCIAIHEQCDDAIVQQSIVTDTDLRDVASMLMRLGLLVWGEYRTDSEFGCKLKEWLDRVAQFAVRVADTSLSADRRPVMKRLAAGAKERYRPPKGWARAMHRMLHAPFGLCIQQKQKYSGKTLKSLLAMCCGGASWKWVTWVSKGTEYRHLVVQRRRKLPPDATVWIGDATASRDRLERLLQRPVIDCTPHGTIPLQHAITVIPSDITRQRQASTTAAYLRAILTFYQPRRLGVIGHRPHMEAIFEPTDGDQPLLSAELRELVHMWTYFGQGMDRASNQWLACDMLVIFGTPRLPERAIRQKLMQQGLFADASIEPTWTRYWADVKGVDGDVYTVTSKAYQEQAWHDECLHQSTSALLQAIGRARAILPEGIPVVVLSNTRLQQFPIDPEHPVGRVTPGLMDVVEAVWRIAERKGAARTSEVAKHLGKRASNVSTILRQATDLGFLHRVKRGCYQPVLRAGGAHVAAGPSYKSA